MVSLLLAIIVAATPLTSDTSKVELIGEGVISTELNDYNPSFTPDGRTMVFARSEPDFAKTKILTSEYRDGSWSAPQPVPFNDDRFANSDPTFSPDGHSLYFISDRPAPGRAADRKDLDIWRVQRTSDGWGTPEHLGVEVNSDGQELGPTINGDSLYFGSSRAGGKGKLDIYRARIDGNGFKPAEGVTDWNSEASEGDPELSKSGDVVLFWSNRAGAIGTRSLFVSRKKDGKWTVPAPLTTLGTTADAFDFTPAFSPDGEWIYFASTRKNGERQSPIFNGESNIYRIRTADALKAIL